MPFSAVSVPLLQFFFFLTTDAFMLFNMIFFFLKENFDIDTYLDCM